jgi:hypothetical protein
MAIKNKAQYIDVVQTQELPIMNLKITKATSDLVTSHIEVSCSGYDIQQCKEGISFLLKEVNKIETSKG